MRCGHQSVELARSGTRRETLPVELSRVLERKVKWLSTSSKSDHTSEAWTLPGRGPHKVMERVQSSAEALGGSIESLYFCFGDFDLLGVVEFPDARGVAVVVHGCQQRRWSENVQDNDAAFVEEGLQALGRASQFARAQEPPNAREA